MTKQVQNATGWYSHVFGDWQGKLLGRKPTAAELSTIHALGARPGKQALANAMALRESGVTGSQIIIACGAPQLNKMRGFIADGMLKRIPTAPSAEGHQVYKLELTAKGQAKVKAAEKADADAKAEKPKQAKPKSAKSARKAERKAKVKAAEAEKVEAAPVEPVTVPVEPVQVEQVQA